MAHITDSQAASVLLVEDSPVQAAATRFPLKQAGYDTTLAVDGNEALQLLTKQHFDLVLLDINMPGLGGREVLTSIRQRYSRLDLPIIVVTGDRESDAMVKTLEIGANDYVTKPLDVPVLLARIRAQLDMSRGAAAPAVEETLAEDFFSQSATRTQEGAASTGDAAVIDNLSLASYDT